MKKELRKKYLEIRKKIKNKNSKDLTIFQKVIINEEIKKATTILIYVSTEDEVDTKKLIEYFLKNKKVAVPKVIGNDMNFYFINSLDDLENGYFNILEPKTKVEVKDFSNALSITPGVCFSKDGYRIGYGKGFYDRFYQKHKIYKIGLCYKECLVEKLPNDYFDINVDEVISD